MLYEKSKDFNNEYNNKESSFMSDQHIKYSKQNFKQNYFSDNFKSKDKLAKAGILELKTEENYRSKYTKKYADDASNSYNDNDNENNKALKTRTYTPSTGNLYEDFSKNNKNEKDILFAKSSKFFDECRNKMKKNEYYDLIECLKRYNSTNSDENLILKDIDKIFMPYKELLKDFKEIFIRIKKN